MRVAVAGAGAFGRNHLRVVRELETAGEGVALVAAVDPDAARAEEAAKQYGITVYASIGELLKADLKLDAAIVAVPTVKHHEVAAALLDAGLDLLVEKPLAATLAQADDLIRIQEKNIFADRFIQARVSRTGTPHILFLMYRFYPRIPNR